ncbi:hypothetical protein Gohar_015758 [Gossypium harknessii]|uniref:Uncharacterized protein n=1 Tax=Gossypium harknessii TaxID=34285 RepID=A0A7J9G0X7_9ROSI|nr:hypothetical protein [Gossypium harknessii]
MGSHSGRILAGTDGHVTNGAYNQFKPIVNCGRGGFTSVREDSRTLCDLPPWMHC